MPEARESIREARAHVAEIVDRADRGDEPTVITRRGREVAAVVPIELLRQFQRWEDEWAAQLVDQRMAGAAEGIGLAEVLAETRRVVACTADTAIKSGLPHHCTRVLPGAGMS